MRRYLKGFLGLLVVVTLLACGGAGAETTGENGRLIVVNASNQKLLTYLDGVLGSTDDPDRSSMFSLPPKTFSARYHFVGSSSDQLNESLKVDAAAPQFRVFLNSAVISYKPFRGPKNQEAYVSVLNGTDNPVDAYLVSSLGTQITPNYNEWKSLGKLTSGDVILDKGSYRVLVTSPGSNTVISTSDPINLGTSGGLSVVVFKGGNSSKVYTVL